MQNELVITRIINAPIALVWEAFTKAEHLAHWWGPTGFNVTVHKLEVRVGGVFHYTMTNNEGHEMWGLFKYYEIDAPNRITFTNSFSDKDGNITRVPFAENWPREIMNVWTFEEQDGKTIMTLKSTPYNATEEQTNVFTSNFPSMNEGFGGTFEKLDEYLLTINQ